MWRNPEEKIPRVVFCYGTNPETPLLIWNPISVYHAMMFISFMNTQPMANVVKVVRIRPRMMPMHLLIGWMIRGFFRYPYMDDMKVQRIVTMKMIPEPMIMYPMMCLMVFIVSCAGVYWRCRHGREFDRPGGYRLVSHLT